jgi:hypothetical protein
MTPTALKAFAQSKLKLSSAKVPQRSSEPKLIRSLAAASSNEGYGAQVVSTPEEALRQSNIAMGPYGRIEFSPERDRPRYSFDSPLEAEPLRNSPLPPIPSEPDEDFAQGESFNDDAASSSNPIPVPSKLSHRSPSLKLDESLPQVPPLPQSHALPPTPLPPAFNPILLSDVPGPHVDRSKVTVTLETCTVTYRTTLDTLISRPSYLSTYLLSLFPRDRKESVSSVYSTDSRRDALSVLQHHMTSEGLIPSPPSRPTNPNIHIFLDRPSAP